MMKSILASLNGTGSDVSVLETAAVAQKMFDATVDCLHVKFDAGGPEALLAYAVAPGNSLPSQRLRALGSHLTDTAEKARSAFGDFCHRHKLALKAPASGPDRRDFRFQETIGLELDETIRQSRYRDLLVVGRGAPNDSADIDRLGTIVLGSGRPVLIAPHKAAATLVRRVVIAWKDTAEAAAAVTAAMPFLSKAQEIVVAVTNHDEVPPSETKQAGELLAAQLRHHGLEVKVKFLPYDATSAGGRLLEYCYGVDADLLVMGGYGHSRLQENVFGGVTREILSNCDLPVLMTH